MLNIFDVDNTIIKKSTAWYFIREALAKRAISLSRLKTLPVEWLRYKMGKPNADFIEDAVWHIRGLKKKDIDKLVEASFTKHMKFNIYAQAILLIDEMKMSGETVLFATSSLDIFIQPLERFFGVTETLATQLEFDNGKATGQISGQSLFGIKKKIVVENWLREHRINPKEVRFYSDSYTDIPLLEYCGCPIAVNPDRFLLKEAEKRGWEIMKFKKTLGK